MFKFLKNRNSDGAVVVDTICVMGEAQFDSFAFERKKAREFLAEKGLTEVKPLINLRHKECYTIEQTGYELNANT